MPDSRTKLCASIDRRFLAPLRRRADTLESPAHEHLERRESGEPVESIAEDYGALERKEAVGA